MAERLPGITDPNAPAPAQPAAGASGSQATPPLAVVPKLLPPAHPDRFVPRNEPTPDQSEPGQAAGQTAPKTKKPATPKAEPRPATPQPQGER